MNGTTAKGFISALFDLSFKELITTKVIKLLYVVGICLAGLGSVIMLGTGLWQGGPDRCTSLLPAVGNWPENLAGARHGDLQDLGQYRARGRKGCRTLGVASPSSGKSSHETARVGLARRRREAAFKSGRPTG